MLDLKISGGTVVDGTGSTRRRADVGVRNGRIVAIGNIDEQATQTIDATGKVVAPGFVDVHTHYDAQVFWDPTLSPSCYHGVTTVFGGFCGFSIAPLAPGAGDYLMPMLARVEGMPIESLAAGVPWDWDSFGSYLARLEGTLAVNAGFMAGHSAIRRAVMGERAVGHKATAGELEQMRQLLRESIEQGAMGFSTTVSPTHNDADGNPVPSRHASREELLALAAVCADYEGTAVELLPGLDFTQETMDLLTDISLAARRPVNWNVLGIGSNAPHEIERAERQLAASDYARARGAEVVALTVQQAMTIRVNLYSGFVFDALPGWDELFRMPVAERIEKLADPAYRRWLNERATSEEAGLMAFLAQWGNMRIVETFAGANKDYVGKSVGEIAAELGKEPFDAMLDIAIADGLKTSFMPFTGSEDRDTYAVRAGFWRDDRTVIGASDAGAHLDMIDTFAYSTKLLEKGVREHGLITLEEAVRQLTDVPAKLMGLAERGVLREGCHADIVVFDVDTVGCGALYTRFDLPAGAGRLYADAEGVAHVVVNGEVIIRDGVYTGAVPGTVLHSGRDTYTVGIPADG